MASIRHGLRRVKEDLPRQIESLGDGMGSDRELVLGRYGVRS